MGQVIAEGVAQRSCPAPLLVGRSRLAPSRRAVAVRLEAHVGSCRGRPGQRRRWSPQKPPLGLQGAELATFMLPSIQVLYCPLGLTWSWGHQVA